MCQDKSNLRRTARVQIVRRVLPPTHDDRSIQPVTTPFVLRPGPQPRRRAGKINRTGYTRSVVAAAVRPAVAPPDTSIGGPFMPVPEPLRPSDIHVEPRAAGRAVRGADGGHDGIGDPGAVRRGEPARGGLARRRHAEPRRAAARHARRRGRRARRPRRPGRAAVRLGAGRAGAARADLRGDGAGGDPGRPERRRGHRRLADGAGPRSPASSATRATSCSPRDRRTWVRWAASPRTRPGSCTSRWTPTAWSPSCCARPCGRSRRRGSCRSSCTRSRTSTTRPA